MTIKLHNISHVRWIDMSEVLSHFCFCLLAYLLEAHANKHLFSKHQNNRPPFVTSSSEFFPFPYITGSKQKHGTDIYKELWRVWQEQ